MSNYLKEIWDNKDYIEFNFSFTESGPTNTVSYWPLTPHSIPPDIHRIRMWYPPNDSALEGL